MHLCAQRPGWVKIICLAANLRPEEISQYQHCRFQRKKVSGVEVDRLQKDKLLSQKGISKGIIDGTA